MLQALVLGTVLGGITAFVWGGISWSMLPWHHNTFKPFIDQDAVARVLMENAPADAVYGLPAPPAYPAGSTKEQQGAIDNAVLERMHRGPLALVVFERGGYESIKGKLTGAFVIGMLCSLLFSFLLVQYAGGQPYWNRVLFVTIAALGGALICRVTDWNWHGDSTSYTVVAVADVAIGWFLVGLVLAKVTG